LSLLLPMNLLQDQSTNDALHNPLLLITPGMYRGSKSTSKSKRDKFFHMILLKVFYI
jgi:hypothetical protein